VSTDLADLSWNTSHLVPVTQNHRIRQRDSLHDHFLSTLCTHCQGFHSVSPADRRPDKNDKTKPQAIPSIISQTYGKSTNAFHIRQENDTTMERKEKPQPKPIQLMERRFSSWRHSHIQLSLELPRTKESKNAKKPVLGQAKKNEPKQYQYNVRTKAPGDGDNKVICPDIAPVIMRLIYSFVFP